MNNDEGTRLKLVAVGSDHAGYALKQAVVDALEADGYETHDFGSYADDVVDYPDIARAVAEAVAGGRFEVGIVICGTGIGSTIAANKVRGIRAAACSEPYSARMARSHVDANILGLGGRVLGPGLAVDVARTFLETEFESGSRHERRVDKIEPPECR